LFIDIGTYGLAWLAGVLSTLSPCVLPIIPIILGAAANAHRLGPVALATGLTLSFTVIGMLISTVGIAAGIDQSILRIIAAWIFLAIALVLLFDQMQEKVIQISSSVGGLKSGWANRISGNSLSGQFALGLVLGLVWSPCVGPTLGAAVALASQRENLAHAALVMIIFGIGANVPLVILGLLSNQTSMWLKGKLIFVGKVGKKIFGLLILVVGMSILTGFDKIIETKLLELSPSWLTELTTSY
jgi:cytochrome c biogenesis protein CcdA